MTISVLIPAYKAAGTICATLDSVLAQTQSPKEVIVLLDGVVDDTPARLEKYRERVKVIVQENQGVACARNRLAALASGEILAFVDADDLWHPGYLQQQAALFGQFPHAVAAFTGHLRFRGEDHGWGHDTPAMAPPELLDPTSFFIRYNVSTAVFGSMSYCCVRKSAMDRLGPDPFSIDLHAIEDSYLCYQLALLGPVAFCPMKLVAYRLLDTSLSQNRVRNLGRWVTAFERLETKYRAQDSRSLCRAFAKYYASKRREFAKVLFGVGREREARQQLFRSLGNCLAPMSVAKSSWLLLRSLLPKSWQGRWPSPVREIPGPPAG